ncbi:MAG: prolipoprotein diacylglyceryl transferase [Anaerolineae bacterium]|nr:MAG: prolipoprotein diacylglyceryl transferase [Anaerolineae bacterium]
MQPTISLGPLVLPTSGIIYIFGAWLALSVVERAAKRLDLNAEATYSLAAVSIAAGFIGARAIFVVLQWPAYRNNLLGIIWPLNSGFELWAGLLFAILAGIFYGRAKQLPAAATLDALAPGFSSLFIVISLADFFGGPGYGVETGMPWAIDVFGIRRHPVQIYEIIIGIAALASWFAFLKRRSFDGQLFLISLAIYSGGRLFVDAYRANAWLTPSGFHILQLISISILLISVFLLGRGLIDREDAVKSEV